MTNITRILRWTGLVLVLLCIQHFRVFGQEKLFIPNQTVVQKHHGKVHQAACVGTIKPDPSQTKWSSGVATVQKFENPSPDKAALAKIKEAAHLKQQRYKHVGPLDEPAERAISFTQGNEFKANELSGSVPTDNTIAISNGSKVITCDNSTIEYYTAGGSLLLSEDYDDFFASSGFSLPNSIFDPKVIYDPQSDRFIFVILHASWASASKVLVCFSKTNNPVDGWWFYSLPGNVLNNNTWFDQPRIAVSDEELFITGNMFVSDGGGFNQTVVFQIDKSDGYAGQSLDYITWNNLPSGPFSLMPLGGGHGTYGPNMYFVSTNSGGGTGFKFYQITNKIGSNPAITYNWVNADTYSAPGDADMPGTSDKLKTSDCRIHSGFFQNGLAHFVFHTDYNNTGHAGIMYNRINASALTSQSSVFGYSPNAYAYPSVTPFSVNEMDQSVAIVFFRSSETTYPEVRAITCDHNWDWSSSQQVKSGETYISFLSGSERWGDYSGICTKYNASTPRAWLAGAYGANNSHRNNFYNTWVAELTQSGSAPSSADFTANKRSGTAPLEVDFTSQASSNTTVVKWEFDGASVAESTEDNPTVTFSQPGVYEVKMTAYNAFGQLSETKSTYIRVLGEPSENPFVCYPLDTDADDGGENGINGTPTDVVFVVDAERGTQVGSFDEGYVELAQGDPLAIGLPMQDITVSTWVKFDTIKNFGGLVSFLQDNGSYEKGWILGTRGGQLSFALASLDDAGLTYLRDTVDAVKDRWYHLAATYDGSTMKLYVDGVLHADTTKESGAIDYPPAGWFALGSFKDDDDDIRHEGAMDEVKIWNKALTANQIAELYTNGSSCRILADFTADQTVVFPGDTVRFSDASLGSPRVWDWTFEGASLSSSSDQNPKVTYSAPGQYTVSLHASDTLGADDTTKTAFITVLEIPQQDPKLCMPLNTDVTDEAGNYTGGTLDQVSFVVDDDEGKVADFADGYITLESGNTADFNLPMQNLTVATWVKFDSYNNWGGLIGSIQDNGSYEKGWLLGNRETNFSFALNSVTNNDLTYLRDTASFSLNTWYHVAATYDGDSMKLFVNGNLRVVSEAQDGPIGYAPTGYFGLGSFKDDDDDIRHDGQLNQAMMWNRALTSAEVAALYTERTACTFAANFIGDPTTIMELDSVQFTDMTAGNAVSWVWAFEGGSPAISTMRNPKVMYEHDGVYDVELIVSDGVTVDTIKKVDYITVNQLPLPPEAGFTSDKTSGTVAFQVAYTDTSLNEPTSWSWIFEGGTPSTSQLQNPTVVYNQSGIFYTQLIATNQFGSDTLKRLAYINAEEPGTAPQTNFVGDVTSGDGPLSVEFTDQSINTPTSWNWTFEGGTPASSTDQNPTVLFSNPGVYTVKLVTANAWGTDSLERVDYITVTESGDAPEASFIGDQTSGFAPMTVAYTDQSVNDPTAWTWTFPGGTPASSTEQHPTVIYQTPGKYEVKLKVSNAFGADSLERIEYITVLASGALPVAAFDADPVHGEESLIANFTDASLNNPTSWLWTFEGGLPSTSNAQNPTVYFANPGNFDVQLIVENQWGKDTLKKEDFILISTSVGVEEEEQVKLAVYPNPVIDLCHVTFTNETSGHVLITLFDYQGKEVKCFYDGMMGAGIKELSFNKNALSSGMYMLKIFNENTVIASEKILIR